MKNKSAVDFILASTSFRRQELLRMMGYQFTIRSPQFDERSIPYHQGDDVQQFVEQLALYKVLDVGEQIPESIILGADTVVYIDGQVIGKPDDLQHAREMLNLLSGQTHHVLTAVCVKDCSLENLHMTTERSSVTFRSLRAQEIEKYIQSGEPLGKAGGYALQEKGWQFLDHIEGSFTNVVGLPVAVVAKLLTSVGVPYPPGLKQRLPRLENIEVWKTQV